MRNNKIYFIYPPGRRVPQDRTEGTSRCARFGGARTPNTTSIEVNSAETQGPWSERSLVPPGRQGPSAAISRGETIRKPLAPCLPLTSSAIRRPSREEPNAPWTSYSARTFRLRGLRRDGDGTTIDVAKHIIFLYILVFLYKSSGRPTDQPSTQHGSRSTPHVMER